MNSRRITCLAASAALFASITTASPSAPAGGTSGSLGVRIYVDSAAPTATGDGSSWAESFQFLQDGLSAAETFLQTQSGRVEIWVARGVYRPDQSAANAAGTNDRAVSFALLDYVTLYGGFAGTETDLSERVLFDASNATVLTGEIGVPGIDDNSYHVVVGNTSGTPPTEPNEWATLNGFTLTGGNANAGNHNVDHDGGGLMSWRGMQVLANCHIVGNRAIRNGGGVSSIAGAEIHMFNCTLEANEALTGGGVGMRDGSQEDLIIHQCLFKDNMAVTTGGLGGAVYLRSAFIRIFQSTIVGNSAHHGGAVYSETSGMLMNSILRDNVSGDGASHSLYLTASVSMRACAISDEADQIFGSFHTVGTIISQDPQFIDAGSGDYRLMLTSPCGDVHDPIVQPKDGGDIDQDGDLNELVPLDLALQPRLQGLANDLGVYESSSVVPTYCEAGANSVDTGGAMIGAHGTCSLAERDLTFTASPVPNTPGLFILGMTQIQNPFGDGFLCAGGEKNRLAPMRAVNHTMVYEVDWDSPTIQAELQVGEVRQVQAWYRDPANGGAGFNTSNAMTIEILP